MMRYTGRHGDGWMKNGGWPGYRWICDQIIETVEAYRAEGIDTIHLAFQPDRLLDQIQQFGEEIIAKLRQWPRTKPVMAGCTMPSRYREHKRHTDLASTLLGQNNAFDRPSSSGKENFAAWSSR